MKKLKLLALSAIVAGFVISCQNEEISEESTPENAFLSEAQTQALIDAGFNPDVIKKEQLKNLDGTWSEAFVAADDVVLNPDNLMSGKYSLVSEPVTGPETESQAKQYRTFNTISSNNRTIDILGFTGSCCALTSRMQTGLQWAVNNYNRINSTLNFRLTFGSNTNGADMIVFNQGGNGTGGSAEFPSNGRPGRLIRILGGTGTADTNTNEHVITHEIGHAVGFRHTDYARRRCDGLNEGSSSVGAVRISGTPAENRWGAAGLDANSIMISCFTRNGVNGEFTATDRAALEFIY